MIRMWFVLPALLFAGLFINAEPAKAQNVIVGPGIGRPAVIQQPIVVRPAVRVSPGVVIAPQVVNRTVIAPPPVVVPHCNHFQVLYRTCIHDPWQTYGTYHSLYAARHDAHDLRHLGYQVRILD